MATTKNKLTLNIAYDGKRAVSNLTGIGNYSRTLVDAMAQYYPDNRYMLFAPKAKDNPQLDQVLERDNVSVHYAGGGWRMLPSVWRSLEMTRAMLDAGADIIHGLSNELPLNIRRSPVPSIVTIHDLIWRRVPQNYSAADRWIFDSKYGASARNATRVIAISECTKRDLVDDFGIDPDKIDVVYQGCNPIFAADRSMDEAQRLRALYALPELYIICVGTVEYRKNQLLAVKALRALPAEVKLVIVGGAHKDYIKTVREYVAKNGLESRVMFLRNVPLAHLPYLYGMARLTAYPSRYEGFGLPVIESLSAGTPVVAATGSCLEEAGGPGAIYVDPDDVEQFVHAADLLLYDNYYYHKYADQGRRYIRKFNTRDFAANIMSTYTKAIMM